MSAPYGLIGRKLGHSYSKIIHESLGGYAYDLIELEPDAVGDFLRRGDFRGLNVTIPYKQTVIPFCARLSASAQRIGAVNTLYFAPDGALCGDNTDYYGFAQMLARAGIEISGRKVLLLGGGGTSLTARAVLADLGAREIVPVSRTGAVNYENVYEHADANVVVNTTPVGMFPRNGERLLDLERLPRLESAVDVIYNPEKTRLLLDAAARGLKTAGGITMLVLQAVRAAEIFLGAARGETCALPLEAVTRALRGVTAQTRNLVLVGMPGCGKSTVGKILAEHLGRELLDTDELAARAAGRPVPEIINAEGEAAFREIEARAVADAGKQSGKIIATGGGAVLRADNRDALRQNAAVVYLRRPLAELATSGRPLSRGGDALAELLHAREPLYRECADFTVDNSGKTADAAAAEIISAFNG